MRYTACDCSSNKVVGRMNDVEDSKSNQIRPDVLAVLRCPITHSPLRQTSPVLQVLF